MKQLQLETFEHERKEQSEEHPAWAEFEESDQSRAVSQLAHLIAKFAMTRFQHYPRKRKETNDE